LLLLFTTHATRHALLGYTKSLLLLLLLLLLI